MFLPIRFLFQSDPGLRRRLWMMVCLLAAVHIALALTIFAYSNLYPALTGLLLLAYSLGLRHAVDPDHIAAIDNSTRKLMQDGQRPVAVGLFFAAGHSTVVFAASLLIAISASFINQKLPAMKATGSLIGTAISCSFLLAIGIINLLVLNQTFRAWRQVLDGRPLKEETLAEHLSQGGLLTKLLKPLLKIVGKSWHMYPIGLLFGLGFDTASEIALLSLAGSSGASGMPVALLLTIPLAFAAGMALIDTADGVLMLEAYGWAYLKPTRKLYYNIVITLTSVLIAIFLGLIEALQVISKASGATGRVWDQVNNIDIANLGFYVIGIFAASWALSVLWYRWRGYDSLP